MGVHVVVRRYIDILTIIMNNFPYSTCISSFFGSSIPTSLFIFSRKIANKAKKVSCGLLYSYFVIVKQSTNPNNPTPL